MSAFAICVRQATVLLWAVLLLWSDEHRDEAPRNKSCKSQHADHSHRHSYAHGNPSAHQEGDAEDEGN